MSDLMPSKYAPSAIRMKYGIVTGGTFITQHDERQYIQQGPRVALQTLNQNVSSAAFHNSKDRFDPPKCHENTRVSVLRKIMDWIMSRDSDSKDILIIWLNGAAGAGKSAIMQTLAELCDEQEYLLASFFFGRLDNSRNHAGSLVATIAYQIYTNIPAIQNHILAAIDNDPMVFERNVITQLATLIHQPLQKLIHAGEALTSRKVILIDGLDECYGGDAQREVIEALFQAVNRLHLPFFFLVASRPELAIITSFNSDSSSALGRIPLDDDYRNNGDIERFLRDKFRQIKDNHRMKRFLPLTWPPDATINLLVSKSSGQFIYAATVIKYVESPRGRPDLRLEIIQGLRPRQNDKDMPFAELDKLYSHILSALGPLEDVELVLNILRFVMNIPSNIKWDLCDLEHIFELDSGSIESLLSDLAALVNIVDTTDGQIIKLLHASFQDFLSDSARCGIYYQNSTVVIREQIKQCFTFIIKCSSSTDITDSALYFSATIFVVLSPQVNCDASLANTLEALSLLQVMRLPALSRKTYIYCVRVLIPVLLHFLKRSDMIEAYVTFQRGLDEEYGRIIKNYYLNTRLSFILANLSLQQTIPHIGSIAGVFEADRNGDALCLSDNSVVQLPLISHYDLIGEYLSKPSQSRQHSMRDSGGRLHSNAVLHCLELLNDSGSPPFIPYDVYRLDGKLDSHRFYDERDKIILSRWAQATTRTNLEGDCDSGGMTPPKIDTYSYLESSEIRYEDDPSVSEGSTMYSSMWDYSRSKSRMDFEQRYLLGHLLYCFPRAGRCNKLLHICEAKLIPNPTISEEYRGLIHGAMDAYVKRWKEGGSGSPEVDEWAYPVLLAERKVSIFTNGEKEAILKLRAQSST